MEDEVGERPWHAMEAEAVLRKVDGRRAGLDENEVEERRARFGLNHLPAPKKRGPLRRFFEQFNNVLIYVLVVAGMITLYLQHWIDAGVVFGVVFINAAIGFIQEGKAEKALEAIQGILSKQARVLRAGRRQIIAAEELVPGDVVYLESGDGIPADLRLLETKNLFVDEAALTGESAPVEKRPDPVSEKAVTGDRFCIAHSGTTVSSGRGMGVVFATGGRTEIGGISRMVAAVEKITTPLLEEIGQLGRVLTGIILCLCGLSFLVGYFFRGMGFDEIFLAAVGIAVAAIPEGLPAVITITLAIGVREMAKRNSIIRRLPAVETLGSVTVICSDKTGTLTRNEMTVKTVVTSTMIYEVSGTGYSPDGEIRAEGARVEISDTRHHVLQKMLLAGILCNDSDLQADNKGWRIDGDPTEGALLPLAMKAGLDPERETSRHPRRDALPFESEHRFMATLHDAENEEAVVFLKGAPETILAMCSRQLTEKGAEAIDNLWPSRFEEAAKQGYRLLAAACKSVGRPAGSLEAGNLGGDFVLLGVFGLMDPPREEAIRAVQECRSGGIQVKMITGDHASTARSIGAKLGIGNKSKVLEGAALEEITDEELPERVETTDVFARSSPEHKIRLVRALQKKGEIVAMTGDGVNDAPALEQANVGIAMGIKGTEVAKQAAEMVIVDDNFASIVEAVKEGRTVYDNIKKSILFILPTNGGEALVLIAAILLGIELPITPVQILWVNMVTAVTLALALAFEPKERGIMERPPRRADQPLLSLFGLWRVGFVSILLLVGVLALYFWALEETGHGSVEFARTVAVNTLVVGEVFYLFNTRSIFGPTFSIQEIFGNNKAIVAVVILIVLQAVFTYLPQAQFLFGSVALPAQVWLYLLFFGMILYALVELEKFFLRKFFNLHSPRIRP